MNDNLDFHEAWWIGASEEEWGGLRWLLETNHSEH